MRCVLIFSMLVVMLGGVSAEELLLLKATNDQDRKVDQLLLDLNKVGEPTHLIHRQSGKSDKSYTPKSLSKGIVLRRQSGNDLLILKTLKFNPSKGASVVLKYLYSGVPPAEYRTVRFDLKREQGAWSLFRGKDKRPLKRIHFMANMASVFGFQQAVGIREVKLIH